MYVCVYNTCFYVFCDCDFDCELATYSRAENLEEDRKRKKEIPKFYIILPLLK